MKYKIQISNLKAKTSDEKYDSYEDIYEQIIEAPESIVLDIIKATNGIFFTPDGK